jgi:hypothetical protein
MHRRHDARKSGTRTILGLRRHFRFCDALPSIQSPSTSTFLWSLSSKAIHYRTKRLSDHRIHILPQVEMRTSRGPSPCSRTRRGSNLRLHVSHVAWRRLPLPRFSRQTTLLPILSDRNKGLTLLSKHLLFYFIKFLKHIHTRPCDLRVQRLVFCDTLDVRYSCYHLVSLPSPSCSPNPPLQQNRMSTFTNNCSAASIGPLPRRRLTCEHFCPSARFLPIAALGPFSNRS